MDFLSQRPLYSTDPSTKGFDLSSGKIWIYPENYPVREYQFQIVKSALYHNTLVCLPTGLGKTFIAAVVMYNFWRWYPQGKIVFLAPTKPLVAQQINACHDIMGIPSTETIELTGATDQKKRQVAWIKHRVIFATPQVFQKDLEKKIVPSELVKCVVVDEAHKALGKHSYCESIRLLSEQNQYFRVLALSATPGGKLDAVQEVVRNLHITHMELRDDRSPDIIPYINERKLDIVLVGLGSELERFKDRYITIMDRHVRVLVENNVLRGFAGNISKGRIFHLQKDWNQKANKGGNHGKIMKTLTILMTMYHAYELMIRHGLRAFYNFYQNHLDKFWLNDENELLRLLEEINYYLGPFPEIRPMPDGTIPEILEDVRFGHNKFQKLKELLLRHFQSFEDKAEETRAIVFVEYRDIVNEVYVLLLQSRPLIRPQKFVGQAGQKQKQQKLALEDFRSNKVNVLISTSVGEEGLDVGEVDLIVCFDISQQSPIRLVQRMGRTGRKRDGHIIVLVTDGKEHQTLKATMSRRDSLNNKVLQSSGIINALHEESPRMVPADFDPECQKMVMTVVPKIMPVKGKGKKKEPKKPRKRPEVKSKTQNPKFAEASTSDNPGGSQSSLMRFFKKPTEDLQMEVDDDFMDRVVKHTEIPSLPSRTIRESQSSQQSLKHGSAMKLSEILLLSSDDAAVEFLTLCTLKKSENEQTYIDKTRTNPYLPAYYTNADENNNFFDFEVPDLKILDCLKNITDCIVPPAINQNDDEIICEPSNRFNYFHTSPQNNIYEEHSKFEALLDESSSDSDLTDFQPKVAKSKDSPPNEQVDWGENIDGLGLEDLLDEWSEESRTSVEKNEPKCDKPSKTPCQSPNNILETPGVFEAILDCSTDESDNDCDQQITNIKSKSSEGNPTTENPSDQNMNLKSKILEEKTTTEIPSKMTVGNEFQGAFEDILNSSSESESVVDLRNIKAKSKTFEQTTTTEIPAKTTLNHEFKGAFEDILNSSSESGTDVKLQNINLEEKCTTKNLSKIPIENELKGTFDDILNSSTDSETNINRQNINHKFKTLNEKPAMKNPSEMPINDEYKGTFEDILNSSSGTETDFDLENINVVSKNPEKTVTTTTSTGILTNETKGVFEAILDTSSDESETDCSLELEPNIPCASNKILASKKSSELFVDSRSTDSFQVSSRTRMSRMSGNIEHDEPTELLPDCEQKAISQHSISQNSRRNFKILSNHRESSTNDSFQNSTILPCTKLTISQTLREIERINSMKNVHTETNVNNGNEREKVNERSTSPVFPDWPRASNTSRLSGSGLHESAKDLILTHSNDQVDEIAESEEDIFGTDDLMVDSDFEAEINNIENSAAQNTFDLQKSHETSAKIIREESADTGIGFHNISSSAVVKRSSTPFGEASRTKKILNGHVSSGKVSEDYSRPAGTSFRCEIKLDDCEWDNGETKNIVLSTGTVLDTVDVTDCDWGIKRKNIRNPSLAKESASDTVDLGDCSWVSKKGKRSFTSREKESSTDTEEFGDCDWNIGVKKKCISLPTKESLPDTVDFFDNFWNTKDTEKSTSSSSKKSLPDTVNFTDSFWNSKETKKSTSLSTKKSLPDTVNCTDSFWSSKETSKTTSTKKSSLDTINFSDSFCNSKQTKKLISSSTKQPVSDIVDLTDCDWDVEGAEKSTPPPAKKSAPRTRNINDFFRKSGLPRNASPPPAQKSAPGTLDINDFFRKSGLPKNSSLPPVKEFSNDILLDDCDWTSDFESTSSPLKPSTSFQKSTESRESATKVPLHSTDRIGNRFSKIGDTTSWISSKKPKLSLSLGKKLLKNICQGSVTEQTCPKPPASKDDSDSENEFAVGRLETTLSKQIESDFFAKPDPVDKVTRPLGMTNLRRANRDPLTLRRNDVNKLSISGLSNFAAPNKYTQQTETRKPLSIGVGRQKSASVDLDTRKKRKKRRLERTRRRVRSEFIDDEAEVSSDENHTAGSSGTDDDLPDFVSYTQHADESVDMQAHYLQTIRSPRRPGAFHMRKPKSPCTDLEIYSQALPDEPNTYLYDSFCVAEDDDVFESSGTPEEISLLEDIEMSLNRKKRKRKKSEDMRGKQKRRVVARPTETSSSEDEFEKLRRQIDDESFTLRNK